MKKHNFPGKFIVFEGLDGSGKSTQIEPLINFLNDKGKEVIVTKEPTLDSEAGKEISLVLDGKIKKDVLDLQKLFAEDREEHLKNKVIPTLSNGKFIVSSRYVFSSFAYGASEGIDLNELIKMNENAIMPDLTIIIDTLPENSVKRIETRGEPKKYFEKLEKLKKVNEFYKKMPETFENIFMVNGERPMKEVFEDIKKIIEKNIL